MFSRHGYFSPRQTLTFSRTKLCGAPEGISPCSLEEQKQPQRSSILQEASPAPTSLPLTAGDYANRSGDRENASSTLSATW